eukprot:EC687297.1.p2 GENE.EC687297.1~~EC687297.1.p2  ORF type:complete len:116 (+),score=43.55 EC687297.1:131-478(+)
MAWKASLSTSLNELRLVFSPTNPNSTGVISFLDREYSLIKALNPRLPILVRDGAADTRPRIAARFGLGQEASYDLTNATSSDVTNALHALVDKAAASEEAASTSAGARFLKPDIV